MDTIANAPLRTDIGEASAGTRRAGRWLIWSGVLLFLLGLLTGMAEHSFANMRMGLAAHLEGVMNGAFLVAVGAVWPHVKLPAAARTAAFWILLYGTFANWATTSLAAIWGTAAANPIISAGHHGLPWQETVAGAGFMSVAAAMIVASVLLLWGLLPRAAR